VPSVDDRTVTRRERRRLSFHVSVSVSDHVNVNVNAHDDANVPEHRSLKES
jgi:hypothetical protein